MPDTDGYPTEEELETILEWETESGVLASNFRLLMEHVKGCWWMADWGFSQRGNTYRLSTGGWSGNEEIIGALKTSKSLFWFFCWQSSRRGGHHVFQIPKMAKQPTAPATGTKEGR